RRPRRAAGTARRAAGRSGARGSTRRRPQLLGRDRQLDGLEQRVGGGTHLGLRCRGPVAEGQEADLLHGEVNATGRAVFRGRVAVRGAVLSATMGRRGDAGVEVGTVTALQADLAVIGGGVGAVAAALAAAEAGLSVVLTEDSDWLGGQLTSQAVPLDENPWIEQFGCTARYRTFRDAARDYYRRWYPLSEEALAERFLNPGRGVVSTLCIEPRVALAVGAGVPAPARASGRLRTLLEHRPVAAETEGDRVTAVVLTDPAGARATVTAPMFLDATETGELLDLSGTEHVTGAESIDQTGE